MSQLYAEVSACRACGSEDLTEVLQLGDLFLSDFQESPEGFKDRAPLTLVRCGGCTLVQLRHTVDRDRLYSRYWYRSALQPAMVKALQDVVRDATSRVPLQRNDVVLDIGANDGTLLDQYPEGVRTFGIEPSGTFSAPLEVAFWIQGYWPQSHAFGLKPKIITSCACFYDTPDPSAWVAGIKEAMHPDGIWVNQLAYLPDTLNANNFGDICHEHLTYWTITSFNALLKRHGLVLLNWSHNDVNGGSIRFIVGHDTGQADLATAYGDNYGLIALKRFAQRINLVRSEVRSFLHSAKRDGKLVLGYGASTKGNTYLQYWGVGPELLPAIADRNPAKVGKYVPTGQVVISEENMRELRPDYLLVLPFHFLDAFIERERDYLAQGGAFYVPFPEPRIVGGADAGFQQGDSAPALGRIQAA